jgi:hypothetical protein
MEQNIRIFLRQLEESGKSHDAGEPQHSQKFLNLETETAEALTVLTKNSPHPAGTGDRHVKRRQHHLDRIFACTLRRPDYEH